MERKQLTTILAICLVFTFMMVVPALAQGTLRIALDQEPPHLDPRTNTQIAYVDYSLFDNLVTTDDSGAILPALARDWEQLSDTTFRFYLHDGIVTHAGNTVDAAAIVAWIGDLYDDSVKSSYPITQLAVAMTAEAVDRLTVDVHLSSPFGAFLRTMTIPHLVYYDVAYRNEVGAEAFGLAPSGTGPFRFSSWSRLERLVVTAFDEYYRGRPQLDEIHFLSVPDMDTKILGLEIGDIDVVQGLPSHEIPRLERVPHVYLVTQPLPRQADLQPNIFHPILQDIRVRKGLAHAIDRELMVEVLHPTAAPTTGLFHHSTLGHKPGLVFDYNPELAEQLLNEAGWERNSAGWFAKDGSVLDVTLHIARGRYLNDFEMAELLESQMRDFGVRLRLDVYESAAWRQMIMLQVDADSPDYGLAGWFWGNNTGVPINMLRGIWGTGTVGNMQHYSSERFDALIEAAIGAPSEEELVPILWELQDIVYDNVLSWPLFELVNIVGVNKRVENVLVSPTRSIRMDLVRIVQ